MKIGLIAEDISDIEVLKILAKKISNKQFHVSCHVGRGSGQLARKTPAWCQSLYTKGCRHVALVHDRDRHNIRDLKARLQATLMLAPQETKCLVIPTEELEAWLLSDEVAIKNAFSLSKPPKVIHHPENIESPKEYIGSIIRRLSNGKSNYINGVHNSIIAESIDINKIRKKCPSFEDFEGFIRSCMA